MYLNQKNGSSPCVYMCVSKLFENLMKASCPRKVLILTYVYYFGKNFKGHKFQMENP